jgi:O-methyltransferase
MGRLELVRRSPFDPEIRAEGKDWPFEAETMVGLRRLDNLQQLCLDVLRRDVPGDFIETGAWRGGATIFMKALLRAYQDPKRTVWVADSFQGLPKPDPEYPADRADQHWKQEVFAVPVSTVKANFERYSLLDERVRFLVGWFKDTLPTAPIERLSILRLDGDMYESTMEALVALYPKLSPGGYTIVDDYGAIPGCRSAVEDFRTRNGIATPIERIDWTGVFWKKIH